jgi:carbamate kinase
VKRVLIAFGGNALIKAHELGLQKQQIENAKEAGELVVKLLQMGYQPVIVHGNGPQVGNILIQQERAATCVPPYTMDVCGAQTQGSVGYLLQRSIENLLHLHGLENPVVTILTEVLVDSTDEAFLNPSKPVGPFYQEFRARELEQREGWAIKEDAGRGWRRLVPSPMPLRIVQLQAITALLDRGAVVIACGGGGIPVIEDRNGYMVGVEAVIDKDHTAALLAAQLKADRLIVLTDVDRVAIHFGKPQQQDCEQLTSEQARQLMKEGHFPAGSMGPKIEAALAYIDACGGDVLITSVEALLRSPDPNQVGTRIIA